MHILGFYAENFKRIRVASISPSGNIVQITGPNGAGKTSVLDAVWACLEWAAHTHVEPIRAGAATGKIVLQLGGDAVEMVVTRTFKRKKDAETGEEIKQTADITVETAAGARFSKPQEILDSLLGALTMDPLAFMEMKPAEQFAALRKFVPGVDFDAIDRANKDDFARRTDLNRDVKRLRAQAEGIAVPSDAPAERVDVTALMAEIAAAGEHNTNLEKRRAGRGKAAQEVETLVMQAADAEARAAELRRQADVEDSRAAEARTAAKEILAKLEAAEPLPAPIDTYELQRRIADAERVNAAADARKRKAEIVAEAEALAAEADALTAAIEDRKTGVQEIIAASAMPVPGIEFGDGFILLNGHPLAQASHAEQLRSSIAIAMAGNPKLKVMRITEGDKLDDRSMQIVAEMAENHGFQVFMEMVRGAGPAAVVIEDGEVVSSALQAAE